MRTGSKFFPFEFGAGVAVIEERISVKKESHLVERDKVDGSLETFSFF